MVREYIVKIADDVTEDDDVLYGKPAKELIRCKDCIYGDVPNLAYRKDDIYCARYEIFHNRDFYCADAEQKDGDGE